MTTTKNESNLTKLINKCYLRFISLLKNLCANPLLPFKIMNIRAFTLPRGPSRY